MDLIEIFRGGRVEADVVRSALEGSGIAVSSLGGSGLPYPVTVGTLGEVALFIRAEDEDRARALIKDALAGEFDLGE